MLTQEFIKEHDVRCTIVNCGRQPLPTFRVSQIDFICHDAEPYGGAGDSAGSTDIYADVKKRGQFLGTRRTGGVSTTGIIVRIIHDYDVFVRRNLSRGMSGKQMNVPYMKVWTHRHRRVPSHGTDNVAPVFYESPCRKRRSSLTWPWTKPRAAWLSGLST